MLVRTLIRFSDLKANQIREVGEEFEVTKKRYEEINSTSFGILVEVIEEKPKKKKSSNKAGD